jgi:DNA polymerase-4
MDRATIVWHCDADAFFVACHVAREPRLRGRPVAVGGDPATRHGIVLTASYEARRAGVRTAMPLGAALARCPDLLVLPPDGALYASVSRALARIWDRFSPVVEPASIDEAWLDMGGGLAPFGGDPRRAAAALKTAVREELGITVSVGVSENKMLAKQASDLDKPDGLTLLWARDVPRRLWPLPAQALYGIGPRRAETLARQGLTTVGDVARTEVGRLTALVGAEAPVLRRRAWGRDDTPVRVPVAGTERSLSVERTLAQDVRTAAQAAPHLRALAEQMASRLMRHDRWGRTVVLKYKTAGFVVHTRQTTLSTGTRDAQRLYQAALRLFGDRPQEDAVRLLGLGVSDLQTASQDLFETDRDRRLAQVVEDIRRRFGDGAIRVAGAASLAAAPSTFRHHPDDGVGAGS